MAVICIVCVAWLIVSVALRVSLRGDVVNPAGDEARPERPQRNKVKLPPLSDRADPRVNVHHRRASAASRERERSVNDPSGARSDP